MKQTFELKVIITSDEDSDTTSVDLHAEGVISRVGKAILLANVFNTLRLNPERPSDLAIISVALDKCSE